MFPDPKRRPPPFVQIDSDVLDKDLRHDARRNRLHQHVRPPVLQIRNGTVHVLAVPDPGVSYPRHIHGPDADLADEPADRSGRRRHRIRSEERPAETPRHAGRPPHGARTKTAPDSARTHRQEGAEGVPE